MPIAFGMVSPAYQGKGLGSALLIARLSLLPKPIYSVRLFMTNVGASQAFYARFGFAPYGTSPSGRPGLMLPCNSALIGEREWQACRERVASLGLTLPTIEVPRLHRSKNVLSKHAEARDGESNESLADCCSCAVVWVDRLVGRRSSLTIG